MDQATGSIASLGRRSKSKNRRVSAGEAIAQGHAAAKALFIDTGTGSKRRISTGALGLGKVVTEEPESISGLPEPSWGAIQEEEEDEEAGEGEDLEELEDSELPRWAQRASFPDDDLGEDRRSIMIGV